MMLFNPFAWYWIVGADKAQVYSSARAAMVPIGDKGYQQWSAAMPGQVLGTPIASMDDLIDVLREANVPPYHRVRKSTIISRVTDEQLSNAIAMMTPRQQERWRASDQPAINADDPETIAVLKAVGADPAIVMAPD